MTPNSSIKLSHINSSSISPSKNQIQSLRTVVGVSNKNVKIEAKK